MKIDRSKPLDLKFIIKDNDWIIEEQDERSLAITELDPMKIQLKITFKEGETCVIGAENLRRINKSSYIWLDAKILQTLLENPALIPESWKKKTNNSGTFIFFPGTVLIDSKGERYILSLFCHCGVWRTHCCCLVYDWKINHPSAVLEVS